MAIKFLQPYRAPVAPSAADFTKFGRACRLSVEVKTENAVTFERGLFFKETTTNFDGSTNNNIVIPPQFTIDFDIQRAALSSSQTATFKIYNLGEQTRRLIYADQYDAANRFRAIQFRAGYVGFTPLIFNGALKKAWSDRQGVDMVTTIEAWDGAFAMAAGFSTSTIVEGTPLNKMLADLAKSLPRTAGTPIVGNFPGSNGRGRVLFGNTWNIIRQESNGLAIIDNGQVKILQPNDAIASDIPVITSASGLLGSPARSGQTIELRMLFEPRVTLGQIVQLESTTNSLYNGTYKVMGFSHKGTISPSVCGPAETTVQLWLGTEAINLIEGTALS